MRSLDKLSRGQKAVYDLLTHRRRVCGSIFRDELKMSNYTARIAELRHEVGLTIERTPCDQPSHGHTTRHWQYEITGRAVLVVDHNPTWLDDAVASVDLDDLADTPHTPPADTTTTADTEPGDQTALFNTARRS